MLSEQGLFRLFDADQMEALNCPAGKWTDQQRNHYAIQHETAATLCWALGMTGELTRPDEISPVHLLSPMYSALIANSGEFFEFATLRPREELETTRDVLMLWCARGNMAVAQYRGLPIPDDLGSWSAAAAQLTEYATELKFIRPIDNDFPVASKAFRELSELDSTELLAAVSKRYETLCWLTGQTPAWDQVVHKTAVN